MTISYDMVFCDTGSAVRQESRAPKKSSRPVTYARAQGQKYQCQASTTNFSRVVTSRNIPSLGNYRSACNVKLDGNGAMLESARKRRPFTVSRRTDVTHPWLRIVARWFEAQTFISPLFRTQSSEPTDLKRSGPNAGPSKASHVESHAQLERGVFLVDKLKLKRLSCAC
jgi:hypothetical protein